MGLRTRTNNPAADPSLATATGLSPMTTVAATPGSNAEEACSPDTADLPSMSCLPLALHLNCVRAAVST